MLSVVKYYNILHFLDNMHKLLLQYTYYLYYCIFNKVLIKFRFKYELFMNINMYSLQQVVQRWYMVLF